MVSCLSGAQPCDGGRTTEAAQHKADLEALRLQDPEFYSYLQQTDRALLDFDLSSEASQEGREEEDTSSKQDEEADSEIAQAVRDCTVGF